MTPIRRILPVAGVALGAALVQPAVGAATTPTDSTEPSSSVPASGEPLDDPASAARQRWLESAEGAEPGTYAGGAAVRDLVDGGRVLMIGDSIMASTSRRYGGEMCEELVPRGWEVEIDAETGRFVDFGDRVLDARLDADWDAAVVMLGNNYGADKGIFGEYLVDIVDRLAPRPTVLLTVTEFQTNRADVNDVIYDIASDHDNVRVADWAGETAADPTLVGGDGLHLSDLGRARYAELVGGELGSAPGFGEGDCLSSNFTDDVRVTPAPGQVTMPPSTWPNVQPAPPPQQTSPPPPTTVVEAPTTTVPAPTTVPQVTVAPTQPPPPPTTAAPPPPPPPTTAAPPPPPPPTTAAPPPTTVQQQPSGIGG
jgi:hypothetical protein